MPTKIYVGGLSYQATPQALRDLFGPYGKVITSELALDKMTGRTKGFGYVVMATGREADAAIAALNGADHMGRRLTVNEWIPPELVRDGLEPITILVDPGDAPPQEIAELLAEISTLFRMVGGSGINFTLRDVRATAAVTL